WQDRRLKIWQEQQRESFLRLERTPKKAQSEVNQRSDANEDDNQKNRALLLHERADDFRCKGIGEQSADDALRDIERKSRQADSHLSVFNQNARNHRSGHKSRFSR